MRGKYAAATTAKFDCDSDGWQYSSEKKMVDYINKAQGFQETSIECTSLTENV